MQSHEEVYRVLAEQPVRSSLLIPLHALMLYVGPRTDTLHRTAISRKSRRTTRSHYRANDDRTASILQDSLWLPVRFFIASCRRPADTVSGRLVFDTTFARSLSLAENRREFLERKTNSLSPLSSSTTPLPTLPILSSACPGWICYAEKTHGELLPFVSAVKSSQGIMGTLVKAGEVARTLGLG